MKIIFPTYDARVITEAITIVRDWMIEPNGTKDQKTALETLRVKVEKSLSTGPMMEFLEFDIFDAVRVFDLLEHILKLVCDNENNVSDLKIKHIVGMAILRTTLKYGISR